MNNHLTPICTGCNKHPVDLPEYLMLAVSDEEEYDEIMQLPDNEKRELAEYIVRQEEGTYNRENGHFLCNMCYINAGMPSSPGGWVAP